MAILGPYTYPPGTQVHHPTVTIGDDFRIGYVDDYGVVWTLDDIEGWDSPASTSQAQQRAHSHGAWMTTPYFEARELSLTGKMRAPDKESARDAADRLFSAITLDDTRVRVDEHGLSRFVNARRLGSVMFDYYQQPSEADWSISMIAADPFKYGTTEHFSEMRLGQSTNGLRLPLEVPFSIDAQTTPNSAIVTNSGNAIAYPVFTINGPISDPYIYIPSADKYMSFDITLGYGRWLTVDTRNHTVVLDGNSQRQFTMQGDWLTVPPGATEFRLYSATTEPDAVVSISWRDSWQ